MCLFVPWCEAALCVFGICHYMKVGHLGNKKAEEMYFVNRFLSAANISCLLEARESPDFVLNQEGASFGLEVTQLLHPANGSALPRRGKESLRDLIIERAQSIYEGTEGTVVIVSVIFNPALDITKRDVEWLAAKLANVVIRNMPVQFGSASEEFDWENRAWFPEEINRVSVARFQEITKSHWYSPDSEFLLECTAELVQAIIEKKEAKLVDYLRAVPECWLLIVLDDFRLSGAFVISQAVLDHVYPSGFTRVFLFQLFNSQLHSLNIGDR